MCVCTTGEIQALPTQEQVLEGWGEARAKKVWSWPQDQVGKWDTERSSGTRAPCRASREGGAPSFEDGAECLWMCMSRKGSVATRSLMVNAQSVSRDPSCRTGFAGEVLCFN